MNTSLNEKNLIYFFKETKFYKIKIFIDLTILTSAVSVTTTSTNFINSGILNGMLIEKKKIFLAF